MKIKDIVKPFVPKSLIRARRAYLMTEPIAERTCNICGFHGWFGLNGRPPRIDARCPQCGSLERHRLLMLAMSDGRIDLQIDDERDEVLHFAAEPILEKIFRKRFKHYKTADLYFAADLKLNIEEIDAPDGTFKLIIANHVLEHVDDQKASAEIARVMTDDGYFIAMVPLIEGWDTSYENPDAKSVPDRYLHFGQGDHVRYYGRDFRERMQRNGLKLVSEITAQGQEVIDHSLLRGEKVFLFRKKTD
ncbi:methyltransferase domain-containing protein [Roseovarius aestuariivivens]|uniref:methyltransferase domain-containing protein n=1 Tax=Roseovarius aestuariivivens TaxID=1888910 RepID=UPI0014367275|nr:methyltransferase domain-containing protein [Roseovarius aestuariivivens]